ncbi:DUF4347 domain-containing protein, partial [Niveispirillum sp. SYP-B3756]|uniref:DUF4347 domain-containing protein n=1 Tax=Niveispirillum sp. SYP-B3756 TaxID=2662178 RepID=UPI0015644C1A
MAPAALQAADPALEAGRKEVVFILSNIADWQTLAAGVSPGAELVVLDASHDGLAQMADWAQTHSGYDAIHIVSHGSEGALQLGSFTLTGAELADRQADLTAIGYALTVDGDILLYGCNVAAGHGHEFLDALADITGANIAASRTLTGAAELGGDWDLGWTRGAVHAEPLRIGAYGGVLMAAPAYTSAVGYIGESTFTITFDSPLDTSSTPALARFGSSVDVNGTGVTVTAAAISGSTVTLTIQASLLAGDIIDFTYADPPGDDASGVLQSASGGLDVASFSHSIVVAIGRPAPVLQSAAVDGTTLVLTYDGPLHATNIPATGAFAVSAGGNPVSVTNVVVDSTNKTVTLTLAQAALPGQTVTVSYTDPTAGDDVNAIQGATGDDAASFSNQSVTNNTVSSNAAPTLDLNGAGTGTGNTVALVTSGVTLADATATAADAEGNWDAGTLTVRRVTGGAADGSVNDVFSFGSGVSATGSIARGADSNGTLSIASTQFATWAYTSASGTLVVTFGTGTTSAQVQTLVQNIGYANATPYGDATIRFSLADAAAASTTADVSVTSSSIYVDATADASNGNAVDGFSLREALVRGAAQSGGDSIYLDNIASGTTLTLSGSTATIGDGDALQISAGAKTLTIAGTGGGGIVLAGSAVISDLNNQSITVSAPISGTGSLTKASDGALTLSGINTYTGGTTLNGGTLTLSGGSALADSGAVNVTGGTLVLGASETIGTLDSSGGTLTLAGNTLTVSGVTLDAGAMVRSSNDTGLLTTSNATGTAITGTSSDDSITGFTGSDTLTGGDGNDTLTGGDGNATADTLVGGNGDDVFVYTSSALLTDGGNSFIDSIDGGAGTDTLLFTPTAVFTFGSSLDWSSRISGIERVAFGATSSTINMTLNANAYAEGLRVIDLSGDTNATGTGNVILNRITGGGMTVIGSAGTDSIVGGSGGDSLSGGAGNDTVNGGLGNDTISAGAGTDSITGGVGNDLFVGSVSDLNGDTITDLAAGDAIQLSGISGLTAANIRVTGTGANAKVEIDTDATDFGYVEVTLNAANLA